MDVSGLTHPGWAEEPIALEMRLDRKEGWVRPTRGRPNEEFDWYGAQGAIHGGTERWYENYSLGGNLFVALQSERTFTDESMSDCVQLYYPW